MNDQLGKIDFTVAVPTYNSASRLPYLLDCLKKQIKIGNISWEVLVIDNNSTDDVQKVVKDYHSDWIQGVSLRCCLEKRQGAGYARQRAAKEAKGELIGFLDDDVLPGENWIYQAIKFGERNSSAGAWGGKVYGQYECTPAEEADLFGYLLGVNDCGEKEKKYETSMLLLPPGLAFVVRRKAWMENVPERLILKGRQKGFPLQADDYEPLIYINKGGWEIWYDPLMKAYHQIPDYRLKKDHLYFLALASGLPLFPLHMILAKKWWHKPFIFLRTQIVSILRILRYLIENRFMIKTGVIEGCKFRFHTGVLMSPYCYWMMKLKGEL